MKIANELKGQIVLVKKKIKAIYSDKGISFAVSFIVLFLFFGCQARNEESNLLLNENETCFNEKLVSITKNGDKYYIGTESSGRIYVYLPEKNSLIDTLNIDCGRIYQVKQTNDANTFYVGTQNMGLKKTRKVGKSLKIETSYIIKGKGNRFSCYDVFVDDNVVYAMTSHGIFKVGKSDTLDVVYANYGNGQPEPFVANNMVRKGNNLFVATSKGLVKITQNDPKIILEKSINNVECHDGYVYALSDYLYKLNDNGNVIDSFGLKASADYYYHTDGINYFLSDNYIILTHDTTLQKHQTDLYKKVFSRRKLSIEGHNIIADSKDYTLLIADNTLWQVGHHLPSVFGELKEGGVRLACKDKKTIYFLVGKKVYRLEKGTVAKEVIELNEKGDINLMECSLDGDSLYYVNNDNEVLRQSFQTPWYKFWPDKPDSIGKSKKEITAMCIDESVHGVILGIRDGLISMNKPNVVNTIALRTHEPEGIDSIPYIRRFFVGDSIYVPTMNEGLFRGKGNTLHIVKGTENLQFIRDVAQPDSILYLLTNRHLFWGNDSIENLNHGSRLLVLGDKIYIPGEVGGVRVMRIGKNNEIQGDSILFPDVSFRAESSWVIDDRVYLGGQSGVIAIYSNNGETRYVKFVDKAPFPMVLLLLLLSLLAIVLCFVLWLRERSITIHWKNFHKESLENKIGRLRESKVYNLLDSTYQSQIDILKNDVDKLPYVKYKEKKQRSKTVSSQIDKFTMEVTHYIMDIVSERKSIYVKLANSNNSKVEEKETNEEGFDQLVSIIEYYNKHIEIEENMTKYRFILERKTIEPPEKIEKMFLYEFRKIGKEIINNIDKIISKTTYSSEKKIEELNTILNKSTHIFIENMKIHIDDMINGANNEAIERLELQTLKNELVSNDIKDMFKLVEKITIADGHLAMMKQMANIQKILKGYNETKREELHQAIENFYIPTIYYGIDLEIYKQLMEITKDEKESPKRIKGTCTPIQQAFVLLAVTMAEQKIPEKDKCNMFLSERAEGKTRERVHTVVTKWVESTFVKEELKKKANDKAGSLYSSIAAFYLNNINQKES